MDPSHKNLVSSLKISQIQKLRTRPSSATFNGNARDPSWMKLFSSKSRINFQSKISKFQPYSLHPTGAKVEIRPKFSINALKLYKVLSKVSLHINEELTSETHREIPDFSGLLEKTASISKLNLGRDESRKCITSRPSTATSRFAKTERKVMHSKFLPKKGDEFVNDVIQLWDNIERGKRSYDFIQETAEDEAVRVKKSVVLMIPKMIEESTKEVEYQSISYARNKKAHKKRQMMTHREVKENGDNPRSSIGIQAEAIVLSERPDVRAKGVVITSRSYNFMKN